MAHIKPFEIPWTPVHNYVFDEIMPKLSPNGWKVLCLAIRQTLGWTNGPRERKEWDTISYSQFRDKAGIGSHSTVRRAIKECLDQGYLLRFKVGELPGTRKPIFAYSLNTDYVIEESTTESVVASTTESVVASTTESVVTKQRQTNKQNDGDGLSKRLIALGVHEGQAQKWASERPPEMVLGWIDYVRRNGDGLSNVPGFLVSKLKAGEEPPAVERGEDDRRRYIEGPYAHLIEH